MSIKWDSTPSCVPLLARLVGAGEEITRTPTKLVEKFEIDGRAIFVKHYFHRVHPARPPKYFFKHPRSWREWRLAHRLDTAGVPIVPHLAHGERWSWRGLLESILVTEGVAGFSVLAKSCEFADSEFQRAFGAFLKRVHDTGVIHHDFHLSNLLYSPAAHDFRLVDLDKISVRHPLSLTDRIAALGAAFAEIPGTDEFFATYGAQYRYHREAIAARARAVARERLAEEAARCLPPRHHSGFAVRRMGGVTWLIRLRFDDASLAKLIEQPDRALDVETAQLKRSRSSTVAHHGGLVIKRHTPHGPRARTRNALRRSRARRALKNSYHFEVCGLPTATAVAAGDRRRLGILLASYFVTRELADAVRLDQCDDLSDAAARVGELLGAMHEAGFSHRDLQASNILMAPNRQPYLIDMEGVRYFGSVSEPRAIADLARLVRDVPALLESSSAFLVSYCARRELANVAEWTIRLRSALSRASG